VYAFFFEPGVLASLFTLKSPMNINTVDEFAFENVMSQATGDEISGALWRDRLRSLRLSGRLIKDEFELRAWFGADWDKVALFTSALPEWNVNTLKPALLRAVLGCTQFKLHNPDAAASALLGARDARYLSDADLRTILGLPKDNPIWAHLGTESSAWTLKLAGESGLVLEVDFMVRPKGEAASVFRMTALRWSHARPASGESTRLSLLRVSLPRPRTRRKRRARRPGLVRTSLKSFFRGDSMASVFFTGELEPAALSGDTCQKSDPVFNRCRKLRLPFATGIASRDRRAILWTAREASFLVRYEGGRLVSIESCAVDADRLSGLDDEPVERRSALSSGPCIQMTAGASLLWKTAALALGVALVVQLAFLGLGAYSSRQARLSALEEEIALIERRTIPDVSSVSIAANAETGLQSRAEEVFRKLSSRWDGRSYLSAFKLKGSKLRLEGWGPNALALLGSLRSDPAFSSLELSSRKYNKSYEIFIFEGEVRYD
jgi:hypothetical protein